MIWEALQRKAREEKQITTIEQWVVCFTSYVSVVVMRAPHRTRDFLAYIALIVKAAHDFEGTPAQLRCSLQVPGSYHAAANMEHPRPGCVVPIFQQGGAKVPGSQCTVGQHIHQNSGGTKAHSFRAQ